MVTEEKVRLVRKKLRSGVPEGEIRNELSREGFSEEEIKIIFKPVISDMRSWYLTFAVILLLAGLYLLIIKESFFVLIFSGFLFFEYYRERKKLTNEK